MTGTTGTRRFPRIPVEYPLLAELLEEPEEGGFGLTNVVGLGGCSFLANRKFGLNKKLKLTISLVGKVVEAEARVVYENPSEKEKWEIGVEFVKISPFDKYSIEALFHNKQE
ncbi:MAG: PilZ domain-containing protein [Thermoanaerobaculaceae bacterium]|nr:PilZ domain-containing protein [Thermoanaerobaculaceae bacterium]